MTFETYGSTTFHTGLVIPTKEGTIKLSQKTIEGVKYQFPPLSG